MTTSTRGRGRRDRSQPIRGRDELIQAVPYLIGYHPAESLVLVGLHDGRLIVTARLDLADLTLDDGLLEHTVVRAVDGGATEFVALVYTEAADQPGLPPGVVGFAPAVRRGTREWPATLADTDVARATEAAVWRGGGALLDAVLVRAGRCWSYFGAGPSDGWQLQTAPSPFAVESAVAGMAPRRDRAAVAAELDPLPDDERAAFEEPLAAAENATLAAAADDRGERHERATRRALFAAARASHEPRWTPPHDTELARHAVALRNKPTRDAVWLAIEQNRLDGRPLLLELARRCPEPYDAAPAFLYGWAWWRAGNTMVAGVAARRALRSDPSCSAAQMLLDAVEHGLDPHRMPKLRRPRRRR